MTSSLIQLKNKIVIQWRSLDASWRFALTAFLIARLTYALWSWGVSIIQPVAIQNLTLEGKPIVTIFNLGQNRAYVYLREVNGEILSFQPVGTDYIMDQQTGSVWNISNGIAMQGPYRDSVLSLANARASEIFPYHEAERYQGKWLSMWQRFDANWYVTLADHGYGTIAGDDHFPPLFPLLIRILTPIFRNTFVAGLFISHAATLFALKYLYDLFTQWGGFTLGRRALIFFLIYPTFFFFFSAYSEPVFIVTALLALRAMESRRWAWAGFWTFCAILTRLQGAALLLPMLYLIWKDRPVLQTSKHWMGLIVAGFGGLVYLYLRSTQVTGGAVPFVEAEWRARLVPPWETYWYAVQTILTGKSTFIDGLNWFVMTLFLILLVWGWKKIPLEYNLYTALSIFIILIRIVETQPLISMSRYSLTLFPSFYALSLAGGDPWLRRAIIYGSLLLNLYLSGQFFIWGWVA